MAVLFALTNGGRGTVVWGGVIHLFVFVVFLFIALMRYGAECRQRAAAGLDADPSVLRQIIIDKNPAAGQYVCLLL